MRAHDKTIACQVLARVIIIRCIRMISHLGLGQLFVIFFCCYNSVCHPNTELTIELMFGQPFVGTDLSVSGRDFQLHVNLGFRPMTFARGPLLEQNAQLGTA